MSTLEQPVIPRYTVHERALYFKSTFLQRQTHKKVSIHLKIFRTLKKGALFQGQCVEVVKGRGWEVGDFFVLRILILFWGYFLILFVLE